MKDNYIFYEFNGERYKIPTEKKGDFERMAPTAKVMMTFKGENYGIPLTEINSFVNKAGANNVTYSAFDDKKKYSPDNSTLGYLEDFKSTSVDVEDNNEDKSSDIKIDNEVYDSLPKELKKPDAASWQAMGETVAPAQSDMDFSVPYSFEKDKTLKDPTRAEENIEQSIFNSHAEHTKNVDDYIAMVDNEYYAKKAKEPEKGFLQKLGESMMRAQDESFKGGTSYQMEELKEDADKGQDYRYAKIAKNISERVDEKINQYNNPAETFIEGVGEGIRDAIADLETWDSTIGAKEAAIVYDISKKHERGEELTAGEQMIVDALVDELATDVYFASGFGRGYKAGKVTGESIPFMLETFTNPASGLGKSITKKFGKGIYKAVRKKLGKALAKSAVYATRVGGDIAGANIMSATTSQNRVIDDALGRLTGHVDFDVNEDGILEFDGFSGGEDSAFKAYAKAYGANTIEHYSEMIGNYFSPLGKMTKKGAAGLADKVGFKKVKSFLTDSPTGFGAFVSDFAEQSQIGGPIGEFAEEVIGGALNAITVGDQSLKKYDENGNLNQNWLFDKDNMIDTFLGVSILGGAMSGAQVIGYKTPEARFDKAINDAKANLRKVASIDDMQKLEAFALNPMGVESANLIPFFDESRSPEYKRTVGEYISAVMQKQGYNISKRADLSGTKQGMREMMDAYRVGQNMSEADLYDVSDAEAKAQQDLVDSGFLDVAGEEGADAMQQALGSSSYELFTLADKLERENGIILDDKQRKALKDLSIARNTKEGLENKLSGYRDMAITANNVISSGAAQDGVLTVGFHNGKKVYVKGNVKLSNGSIVKPSDIGSYPVEIVDAMTGEATSVESGEVSNVENIDIVDYNNAMANIISTSYNQRWEDWRNKKSAKSKLAEVEQYVGQKVFINTPDGKMAEVEVQQILPNGEVLIKGKKGDLGQPNIRVDVDSFYDSMSRDADGNPIFNQSEFRSQSSNIKAAQDRMYNLGQQGSTVGATTAQPTAPVAQAEEGVPAPAQTTDTEVEVSEEDDFRGEIIPILINGVPVEVEVISQDGPSNTIVYEYEDENGNTKRGKTTIGGFKAAAQQAQNYVPETPAVETPVAEVDTEVPATEVPTTETPVSEVPLKPEDIDWDVLFEQDPESYFLELQKQFGDKTATMLNAVIAATQSELESLNKAKPKTQNEIFANEAQKEVLQSKIDVLNGMLERLNATEAPVVETPAAPEVPETETPVAETPTTPEVPATETPTDNVPNNGTPSNTAPEETPSAETPKFVAPEGGFIMDDGHIINPIVIEMPGVEGESNKIYLAEKDGKWGANWLVVLDNGSSFGYRSNPKIQKEWLVHDTPEKAIADALKFFDYVRTKHKNKSSSSKIDTFMQWAQDTYLKDAGIEIPSTFVPEAPTPVENPIQEAKKKEKSLATQLKRYDLSHELKQDLAFKAGKAVADFFATREEYDDYAEFATDFGEYNADFERGVDESFANRQQNAGNSPVNSVPLENQPKGENNGESGAKDETSGNGPSVPDNSGRTANEGAEGGNQTAPKVGKGKTNKGKTGKQVDKYPARKGNATQKMLVDTFGFNKVEIPNSRKETLNTIYDFMMAMSKMLGISPTSIGQGGWLDVGSLRSNAQSSAEHSLLSKTLDQSIVKATIKYKYATLTGLAHEWWHALDHALSYFETGKGKIVASELPNSRFTGRQETWYAVNQVIRAIKDSGHENRMHTLKFPLRYVNYLTENTEMAARAFDEYIKAKFAEAGIVIENATDTNFVTQPTAEEMAVITPAFDNLFNVLQEKEGKNPGTTVLFHIGEQMEPGSDAWKLVTESVLEALNNAKIDVTRVSDEEARQMIAVASELTGIEMMTVYHGSPHKFSAFDHSKIGTGEGAQAHGWGTYVARNKETGVDYAKTLRRGTPKIKRNGLDVSSNVRVSVNFAKTPLELVATAIDWYGVDRAKAQIKFGLQEAEKKLESDPAFIFSDALEAKVELYKNALALFNSNSWETEENPAHLYTVEIPEDTGSNYLSETAYTDTQIEKISDACKKEGIDFREVAAISSESSDSRDGARLYNALIQVLGSDKAASEFLSRAGFSGIKYTGNQDGPCFVIFNDTEAKITGYTELCQTPDGIVYGWTNGKKIFLTEAGMNPNTPIHEYTHIWARAMMQKNPKGWNSIKKLLKGTPVWNDVINDPNYSNISNDEDAVASEALSRISGSENAAKMEYMAQKMIDEAKSTGRKLEASGLIQNMRDALNRFWEFVWKDLFGMTNFRSVEQVTDRVLFDLLNGTDLGELREEKTELQIAGKKGAYNLDIEEEFREGVAYRMNALELAEQLESEGFDKKQIRTATGWERGYDGKWRYEIDDLVIKDNIKLKKGMTLGDIAEKNELFKAYPFLADIEVRKMTTKEIMETDADGAYIEDDNTIIVRIKNDDGIIGIDEWEVLVHEVQHAIQHYEGFTTGASESFVRRNAHEILREEEKKAKPLYDRMAERSSQLADEMREEVYAQLPKRMSKRDKERALAEAVDKAKFSDEAFESIRQQWLPYAKRIQTLKILTGNPFYLNRLEDPMVIWDLYKSYAGEVEARNAVNRMYLSPDERAEITFEETEDTPRERQVAIGESSYIEEARKKRRSNHYKAIPQDEYAVLADDLFREHKDKTVYGTIGYTSNYFYLCDYFGDRKDPKVIAIFEIEGDEDTRRRIEQLTRKRYGLSKGDIVRWIEDSWVGVSRKTRDTNGSKNEGTTSGDAVVASTEYREESEPRRGDESTSESGWISLKSGYDGSKFARIRFVDESEMNSLFDFTDDTDDFLFRSDSNPITPEMDAEYLAAVERGDMETAQRMVNEAADKYLNETLLPNDEDEVGFKYHRGPAPAKTFKRYAVLNVTPEGFKAAYAGNKTGTPVGVWLDAQNLASYTSDMVQFDDGTFATYIAGDTGAATNTKFSPERAEELGVKGGQRWLLERGGKHSSDVPNFSQMNLKVNENGEKVSSAKDGALPHNKLIFEIEYGISEEGDLTDYVRENGRMMKGKNQGLAKIGPNQYYDFKTNPNAVGNWGIGGTFRITRLVPHSEIVSVTEQYKKDAIAEADRLYESGDITKKDRDARVKSAESIQVQKWVGGYNPADFGLSEEIVKQMAEEGSKMKLTDPVTYDDAGNVIPLSERFNPEKRDIRYRKSDIQNAAADYLAGPQRAELIQRAVNEEATKLGVTVTYKTRSEMPKGHQNDKGYYNTKTGEIVICTENASSIADAIQTILHEAVAHKGLRALMGDKFNEFINRVYESLDAETKAKVDALAAEQYEGNTTVAMEEYMASLAETENFAENSLWDKIKSIFENIINTILNRTDIKIGDNELRYILRASYNNLMNPNGMESMRIWAQDQVMREEYKINQASPEILSRTGIDPTKLASESARQVYDYNVSRTWNEFQRQFQDAMQPVRVAIDAIQQATGNVPIEDYENYILVQNQSSSRSRVEIDEFSRNYYTPVINQVNAVIDSIMQARGWKLKDKKKRSQVYAEVRQYLIAKHGLERNEYYQSHNMRKLNAFEKQRETAAAQKEYDDNVNVINNDTTLSDTERELQLRDALDELNAAIEEIKTREVPDIRDYSGLTSLFGMEPKLFREAEAEAEKLVDTFEAEAGPVTEEMWKKINAATDKTLRHSYESGMISRQQYNDIKAMFEFYVPLRGFDETTAEDVYSYARFEGNRFNPAVQTAKGRTSVADDPIAIIMNMAESEIAQGNKNRAKQALYNYLLNRSEGKGTQNSLMKIESVWYVKAVDANGKETLVIAAPDHENGETYEEFEARMNLLAAEDKAAKSKKGHVDVGVRFQKQMNRNAHYVYLKVNGVDKAIYVNGDPKAADAINGVYAKPKGTLEEKMGTVNRFISSTFTNYSLEFTARNYFRDMIYSHINIDVRESDRAYRKKFRQNWRHNNLATMLKMLKAYRAGKYNDVPLNEDQAAFVEFMQNGGQTGYTIINSVENRKKELENAIERMQKGLEKGGVKDSTVFKFTLGAIEMLNEASELVTRFAAFKTSRDMGRGVVKAISDAKEITVNFNTKGAQDGKGLMGGVARYFGWSKFFFNASVQGVQNIAAMARANKLKFGTVAGGMVAFGFVMPIITSVISNMLGGDDDEYWNIPEYDRQNNVCIVLGGGKYAKIPLPIAFRELYGIGDMVAAWAFNKKFMRDGAQVGMDAASKIATIVLPINPIEGSANGLSAWETFLYTSLPSSFQFAIQNATNTDWKGAPLQKEYTYNEDDPQWMKAFKSNPDWMVGISKWCNEHIGTGDYKGWDWSPEKLDNTLSNMFGGMYSLIKKTGKTISMAWNEEERNLSNVPLAGVIVGSGIDSNERYVNDAYFTEKEYYDERIGSIKRIAKKFGYDLKDVFINGEGKHRPKMIKDIYGKKDFDFMQEWYLGHEGNPEGMTDAENWGLDKMRQEIKKIEKEINKYEDDPPQELIEELNRLNKEFESYRRELVEDLMELD